MWRDQNTQRDALGSQNIHTNKTEEKKQEMQTEKTDFEQLSIFYIVSVAYLLSQSAAGQLLNK